MSTSASTSISAAPGPSGQNPHALLQNNEEKNRSVTNISFYLKHVQTRCLEFRSVVIKVGMVGDSQIGKTSLMVKYVEGSFDEDYIQTLGESLRSSATSQPR